MRFTQDEDWIIEQLYQRVPASKITLLLGRPRGSVKQRMRRLGLQPFFDFADNGRFKKGHVAWNKGTKGLVKPNVGSFKKGNNPPNTMSNGDITVRKDSSGRQYKFIRLQKGKWELLHRKIWKEQYGDIPTDSIIVFKDGNSMNCTLNNLEMISRSENMRRNTIMQYPAEMRLTFKLISKIKKNAEKYNERLEQRSLRTA